MKSKVTHSKWAMVDEDGALAGTTVRLKAPPPKPGAPPVLWVTYCVSCGRVTAASMVEVSCKRTADNACRRHPKASVATSRYVRWSVVNEAVAKLGGK